MRLYGKNKVITIKERIMAEKKSTVEATVKNIRRRTRKKYSAEEKMEIIHLVEHSDLASMVFPFG